MMDSQNNLDEITDLAIVGYYIAKKFINADSWYLVTTNNLSDLNLNNDLETLDLLGDAIRLGLGLYSYLWYSNALPKNLQVS